MAYSVIFFNYSIPPGNWKPLWTIWLCLNPTSSYTPRYYIHIHHWIVTENSVTLPAILPLSHECLWVCACVHSGRLCWLWYTEAHPLLWISGCKTVDVGSSTVIYCSNLLPMWWGIISQIMRSDLDWTLCECQVHVWCVQQSLCVSIGQKVTRWYRQVWKENIEAGCGSVGVDKWLGEHSGVSVWVHSYKRIFTLMLEGDISLTCGRNMFRSWLDGKCGITISLN